MVIDAWTYNAADNSEEEEEQSDSKSVRISLHKFISMLFKLGLGRMQNVIPCSCCCSASRLISGKLSATHLISTTHANTTVL